MIFNFCIIIGDNVLLMYITQVYLELMDPLASACLAPVLRLRALAIILAQPRLFLVLGVFFLLFV